MTKDEVLKQLREVHAIQGSDGCWDIDDYMLGLYNGLELALSIVENRECRYKQRPKSQPEQEPVAWMFQHEETGRMTYVSNDGIHDPTIFLETNPRYALVCPLYTTPPQRTWVGLTDEEIKSCWNWETDCQEWAIEFARAILRKAQEK
jgi:hypothetical protein